MQRLQVFEFNDQPWLPSWLREDLLAVLGRAIRAGHVFDGMAPILREVLERTGSRQVLDLCSGAGEPVSALLDELRRRALPLPEVMLSDLYPNVAAFEQLASRYPGEVSFAREPVDATAVPVHLARPVRTFINALHHFPPKTVRAIFADAVKHRSAILALEGFPRHLPCALRLVPWLLAAAAASPIVSPRRRLAQAALLFGVPVMPAIGAFDFLASVVRIHAPAELHAIARSVDSTTYYWAHGEAPYALGGRATFFYGVPRPA